MTLADLQSALTADRAEIQRAALLPSATPLDTCRYCRRHWRGMAGTKLDGHAICYVSGGFQARVHALMRDPKMTFVVVSQALGMSLAVIRAWWIAADRQRRRGG